MRASRASELLVKSKKKLLLFAFDNLGAHFTVKGKGGTYPKEQVHLKEEVKRGITRGENGALLAPNGKGVLHYCKGKEAIIRRKTALFTKDKGHVSK